MQNEKTPTSKHLPKIQKNPEFVDTDSDNTDNEQETAAKQPQKAPKNPEFVDTYSGDMDDEKGPAVKQPKKVLKPLSLLIQTQMIWTMKKGPR